MKLSSCFLMVSFSMYVVKTQKNRSPEELSDPAQAASPYLDLHEYNENYEVYNLENRERFRNYRKKEENVNNGGQESDSRKEPPRSHRRDGSQRKFRQTSETTVPEILIFSVLGFIVVIILVMLCLASQKCVQRFISARKALKKAMQYRPSKYSSRVTPTPSPSGQEDERSESFSMKRIFHLA